MAMMMLGLMDSYLSRNYSVRHGGRKIISQVVFELKGVNFTGLAQKSSKDGTESAL